MTPSPAELAASLGGGAAVGAVYLGCLWWTVRRLVRGAARPLLIAAGFGLRVGALAFGLYLVSGGEWPRLLAGLAGFIVTREAVLRSLRKGPGAEPGIEGGGHGS